MTFSISPCFEEKKFSRFHVSKFKIGWPGGGQDGCLAAKPLSLVSLDQLPSICMTISATLNRFELDSTQAIAQSGMLPGSTNQATRADHAEGRCTSSRHPTAPVCFRAPE